MNIFELLIGKAPVQNTEKPRRVRMPTTPPRKNADTPILIEGARIAKSTPGMLRKAG